MLRKAIALIALAAATVIVGPAAAAPASAAPVCGQPMEPPCIPTKTHISVDAAGPGEPIELTVSASANYPTPPEGDIAVTVIAGNGGAGQSLGARAAAPLFRTTVHFVDDAVVINGPALPRGDYIATAAFTRAPRALHDPLRRRRRSHRVHLVGAADAAADGGRRDRAEHRQEPRLRPRLPLGLPLRHVPAQPESEAHVGREH